MWFHRATSRVVQPHVTVLDRLNLRFEKQNNTHETIASGLSYLGVNCDEIVISKRNEANFEAIGDYNGKRTSRGTHDITKESKALERIDNAERLACVSARIRLTLNSYGE